MNLIILRVHDIPTVFHRLNHDKDPQDIETDSFVDGDFLLVHQHLFSINVNAFERKI